MTTKTNTTTYNPEAFAGSGPRVFNHTPYPTDLLTQWWVRACERMGADPNGVVVKFTCARKWGSSGCVRATTRTATGPPLDWCLGRRKTQGVPESWLADTFWPRVASNGAWVHVRLPSPGYCQKRALRWSQWEDKAISAAEWAEYVMLHEAHHVREDQEGGHKFAVAGSSGRRVAWRERPEEQRAQDAARFEQEYPQTPQRVDGAYLLDFAEHLRARHLDQVQCTGCGCSISPQGGYRLVRPRYLDGLVLAACNSTRGASKVYCRACALDTQAALNEEVHARRDAQKVALACATGAQEEARKKDSGIPKKGFDIPE